MYKALDAASVYIENAEDNTVILGYELSNAVGSCALKIYIDGKEQPYFEAEQTISFSIYGHNIAFTSTGYGTVTLDEENNVVVNLDGFNHSGGTDRYGNTVTDLVDEEDFRDFCTTYAEKIVSNIPDVLKDLDLGIGLQDLV